MEYETQAEGKKRLQGKQAPKAKAAPKAAPKAKAPKAPPNAVMEDHAKKNMTKGLAEAVRKRQGKPNIKSTMPVSMDDAFRKMPETVRKVPEFQRKFKEEILNVPMTGVTSRENYAKLIAERQKLFKDARKQNIEDEWMRLNTEIGERAKTDKEQERITFLEAKYHDFDEDLGRLTKVPKPAGYVDHVKQAEAERLGQAVAAALRRPRPPKGKGKGKEVFGDAGGGV